MAFKLHYLNKEKTFEELFKHYHEGFGEYIEQTVNELNALSGY